MAWMTRSEPRPTMRGYHLWHQQRIRIRLPEGQHEVRPGKSLVQGELNFAIVDEVDSILIDEARTPLIISGPAEKSTDLYYQVNDIIPRLKREQDYTIDEKARSAVLTEEGVAKAEQMLKVENLYDPQEH